MKLFSLRTLTLCCTVTLISGLLDASHAVGESATLDKSAATYLALPETDDGLPGAGPIRRYDWFKNLWTQRRTEFSKAAAQDQKALVFLGDSITQGWGDLGATFAGVKTANRGISGDTTRGMLLRLQDDVLALNPSGVVLLMGTNDLEENASPETIAGNFKLIVDALKNMTPNCRSSSVRSSPALKAKNDPRKTLSS